MIEVKVTKNIVSVQKTEPLTAGSVSVYNCHFTFDEAWDGFSRAAVFRAGKQRIQQELDADSTCEVPWEVLQRKYTGYPVLVSVYGVSSETEILPTTWGELGELQAASTPGDNTSEPTASAYDQFVAKNKTYADKAATSASYAANAAKKAEAAAAEAKAVAASVQAVSADVEAAKAAKEAAQKAQTAAETARAAAEAAAQLAAQAAAADLEAKMQGYISSAEIAKSAAEQANADAQNAASNVASQVQAQMSDYVAAAQAAQAAAEKAREEAKAIAGGNFASADYVDQKAETAESNANKYTDEKIAAIPTPDVGEQIGAHNTATDAHNDIRLLLAELTTRFNALANSEDVDLDQLEELVAYIKDNRSLIEQITTNKVNVSDIIDNLTTNVSNKPLSAAQGVALKALIDAAANAASAAQSTADGKQSKITGSQGQVVGFDTSGNPVAQEAPKPASLTTVTAVLSASAWALDSDGLYAQTVAVEGVTTDPNQVIVADVQQTGTDLDADNEALAGWAGEGGSGPSTKYVAQGDGVLTFHCTEAPTINIPLNIVLGVG